MHGRHVGRDACRNVTHVLWTKAGWDLIDDMLLPLWEAVDGSEDQFQFPTHKYVTPPLLTTLKDISPSNGQDLFQDNMKCHFRDLGSCFAQAFLESGKTLQWISDFDT